MEKKRKIRVFVGYQIDSNYHSSKDLKNTYLHKEMVENQLPNIDLDIKFGEFRAGKVLWNEVFNTIKIL